MDRRLIPVALFGFGAVTTAGGAALAARGTQSISSAQRQIDQASARHCEEQAGFEARWRETNQELIALGERQAFAYETVTVRMTDFLERHEKLFNEKEKMLLAGFEPVSKLATMKADLGQEPQSWMFGILNSARAGVGLHKGFRVAASNFANASTGRPISTISGAAEKNAISAFFGGGSKLSGGAGKVVGNRALVAATVGPAVLMTGLLFALQGEKAKTGAHAHESSTNVQIAELARRRGLLEAIVARAAELSVVLELLREKASIALDLLESEPFEPIRHEVRFRQALTLTIAVSDVLAAEIIDGAGDLDAEITYLRMKYRPLTEETHDD